MKTEVLTNYEKMSERAAQLIIDYVNKKPDSVLCIAGGDTPKKMNELLVKASHEGKVDFSQCTFIELDDWVGLGKGDEGSCVQFLYDSLFIPMDIREETIFTFNAKSQKLHEECKRIDQVIFEKGGIDIIVLGVGMNGHLGFNEPGVSFESYSHVIDLDNISKTVGQKYFSKKTELTQGITLGIKHILEAKIAILIANGTKKAAIVKQTVEEDVSNQIPSTVLKTHPNAYLFVDEEAGSLL